MLVDELQGGLDDHVEVQAPFRPGAGLLDDFAIDVPRRLSPANNHRLCFNATSGQTDFVDSAVEPHAGESAEDAPMRLTRASPMAVTTPAVVSVPSLIGIRESR